MSLTTGRRTVTALVSIFVAAMLTSKAMAVTPVFTVLHNFTGADGQYPDSCPLIQYGNVLYGTTRLGGANGKGTVYAFDLTTKTESILHSFTGGTDGAYPHNGVARVGNILYGTTEQGAGSGALYAIDLQNISSTVVHSFHGGTTDGSAPLGAVLQSGNMLYGMTRWGGTSNNGTIYSVNTASKSVSILHSFAGGTTEGSQPFGSLIQSGNMLYGTTYSGGANNTGTLFSFNLDTGATTLLHSFVAGTDGSMPWSDLVQSGTTLYGTTAHGGSPGDGTLFSYDVQTNTYKILHGFTGSSNGSEPYGGIVQSGSTLYGLALGGGSSGRGAMFSYDTSNQSFALLHSFTGADGQYPYDTLLRSGDTFYGTTSSGGSMGDGVLFSLAMPEPTSLSLVAVGAIVLLSKRRR